MTAVQPITEQPLVEIAAPNDDRRDRQNFLAEYMQALKPEGLIETGLAETIADSAWHLNRARLFAENIFDTAFTEISTFTTHAKSLQSFALLEQRLGRVLERTLNTLRKLQAGRLALREKAFTEAKNLAQLNYSKDLPYDPSFDFSGETGFTFSSEEINRSVRRDQRVKEAARDAKNDFNPAKKYRQHNVNVIDLFYAEQRGESIPEPPDPHLEDASRDAA